MDIENFPTSGTAIRMMQRVSPIYGNSYVAKWLFQVMGIEMGEARQYYEELRAQAFPETATWGLTYWEQRYGIATDETISLNDRRQKIVARRGLRAPMNPARLERFINDMCGRTVTVEEDPANYTFTVTIMEGSTPVNLDDIVKKLKRVKPSHLSFIVRFETAVSVTVSGKQTRYNFPYILTGTEPDTNTIGSIDHLQIIANTAASGSKFDYPVCGEGVSGE